MEKSPKLDHIQTREEVDKEQKKYEKDMERARTIMKNESPYEVTEDSEFFIIQYPHKTVHIPKRQHLPLVRDNGLVSDIAIETVAHALCQFPDDNYKDAIEKYEEKIRK